MIFVATGNNEGYLPATTFNQELHKWILYRVMKKALLSEPRPEQRSYFTPQNPDALAISKSFQKNIHRIVKIANELNIPLFLATLPIHL